MQRCVRSVVDQGLSDFEIILVDDGSTDGSSVLCDELAKTYPSVTVVHQPNAGLSHARNTGIEHSRGEYITFVDSDDWLSLNTYAPLLQLIDSHGHDIVEFPLVQRCDERGHGQILTFGDKVYTDMKAYWLDGKAYTHTYACNKLYRRKLFDYERFSVGKKFEDVDILPRLLNHSRKVVTTTSGLYYYYDNAHGITATADGQALTDLLDAHRKALAQWHDAEYYAHVVNIALDVYRHLGKVPQLVALPYHATFKLFLKRIFGFKCLCRLHKLYKSLS